MRGGVSWLLLLLAGLIGVGAVLLLLGWPSQRESEAQSPAESDIRFLLKDTYNAGERTAVAIENVGSDTYSYYIFYQTCYLSYFDSTGGQFIIPPGTHCDIANQAELGPGETVQLFEWNLDECIVDQWGCVENRPQKLTRSLSSAMLAAHP